MKTSSRIFRLVAALTIPFLLWNCKQEDGMSSGSYLSAAPPAQNELDNYILENYTKPYNIEVVYRWTESLVDPTRYLHPPLMSNVQPALNIVKKLWVEPYSSMNDPYLVSKVAPRQLILVGGRNVDPSGTITLGLAEGGKRITLFELDLLVKNDRDNVTRFIHTIQHEYIHILNQTKPFDEQNYGQITPSGYTAEWFNEDEAPSRQAGFITPYSRANVREDFAEMASTMLNMSRGEWNKLLKDLGDPGAALIRQKEQIIVAYYKSQYGIDFYKLQKTVNRALLELLK